MIKVKWHFALVKRLILNQFIPNSSAQICFCFLFPDLIMLSGEEIPVEMELIIKAQEVYRCLFFFPFYSFPSSSLLNEIWDLVYPVVCAIDWRFGVTIQSSSFSALGYSWCTRCWWIIGSSQRGDWKRPEAISRIYRKCTTKKPIRARRTVTF